MSQDYHNEQQAIIGDKLDEMLQELPACCRDFYNYMINNRNKSIRTCRTYIGSFKLFFHYVTTHDLEDTSLQLNRRKPNTITCDELERITENDVYDFLTYLSSYKNNDVQLTNSAKSKNNKLSALKSLYKYLAKTHKISKNALANVDFTDIAKTKRTPVHLEIDETAELMDIASDYETKYCGTRQSKAAISQVKYRDLAILLLLCSTGLRVSEMVALNIEDINFKKNSLTILRKGGFEQDVFMNDETADAIQKYITQERTNLIKTSLENKALFISMHRKRLSVRSVEALVNKYSVLINGCSKGNGKSKITPHRLRATYATLFLENGIGDLKELAENMGHSSTNTTTIYSGVTKDYIRQKQAQNLKIREPE